MAKCSRCGYNPSGKCRSNPQNKYYWGCVVHTLSEDTGYTHDEIHEIIKHKFLTERRICNGKNGKAEYVAISKSTTSLNTKEFEELMSQIRIWASASLGIPILEPNEVIPEEYK